MRWCVLVCRWWFFDVWWPDDVYIASTQSTDSPKTKNWIQFVTIKNKKIVWQSCERFSETANSIDERWAANRFIVFRNKQKRRQSKPVRIERTNCQNGCDVWPALQLTCTRAQPRHTKCHRACCQVPIRCANIYAIQTLTIRTWSALGRHEVLLNNINL